MSRPAGHCVSFLISSDALGRITKHADESNASVFVARDP
jgi:hypothetical protein